MDVKELFYKCLKTGGGCVPHIKGDQLVNSTPCTEWNLKQLLNHMVYELLWIPDLLEGKTIAEVGDKYEGDVLGNDFKSAWDKAAANAKSAVEEADLKATVHLSYGDKPASHYITEAAADMLIHGWDEGQAVKCSVIFDEDTTKEIYEFALPQDESLRAAGDVGPKYVVEDKDAEAQTWLLAFYGRKAPAKGE